MKQRTFKTLLFLFVFACLSSLLFVSASAAEEKVGDFVFTVNGSTATLKEYKGTDADVTIPSKVGSATVTTIGNEAFWGNSAMKTISIPSTVKVIGTAAFNECTSLTRVVLPSKLTTLGNAVFWYCTNLKQVFIPKTVTTIGENVFVGCHKNLTVYVVKGSYGETAVSSLSGINMAYRYITSLRLSSTAAKLQTGETKTLTYTYSPSKVYSSKVTFASDNTKVATVDANGKITAVGVGTAVITCTTKDGGKITATCKITVVPQKVTGFRLTNVTPTGYTLSWDKSEGATRYRIYRYNSSTKKYETIQYTSKPTLTVTDMEVGSYQYYRVLAYTSSGGTYYLADTSATYKAYVARPAKVTGITAKPAHNYINLSWSKAENATGYRVYLYNRETSKYTFLGAVTKTSYKAAGLNPNTEYTFMVRAYLKHNGTAVYASYSDLTDCTTRPDYVETLSVKEGSVYTSRVTLQWETQQGVAGYQISKLNEQSGAYDTIATLYGQACDEYTAEGLEPGTTYQFKIRAFAQYDSGLLYGYISKNALSVTTNDRPADDREAFKGFVEAYNASKTSEGSFTLISIFGTADFEGENSEEYEGVITSTEMSGTAYSYIADGIDKATKLPVTALLAPENELTTLSYEDTARAEFDDDGNGYRITFSLNSENDGTQTALIAKLIDWQSVAEENDGFVLNTCIYEGTTVTAKIQNGYIDDITVTVPVTVSFSLNGEAYEFSTVLTQTYLFIW